MVSVMDHSDGDGGSLIWYICSLCLRNHQKSSVHTFRQRGQLVEHKKRVHGNIILRRKKIRNSNEKSLSTSPPLLVTTPPSLSLTSVDLTLLREEKRSAGLQKEIQTNLELICSTNCELQQQPEKGEDDDDEPSLACGVDEEIDDDENFCEIQPSDKEQNPVCQNWTNYFCILNHGSDDDPVQYIPVPFKKPRKPLKCVDSSVPVAVPKNVKNSAVSSSSTTSTTVKRGRSKKKKRNINKKVNDNEPKLRDHDHESIDWEDRGEVDVVVPKNQKLFCITEIPGGMTPYSQIIKNIFRPTEDGMGGEPKWRSVFGPSPTEFVPCNCVPMGQSESDGLRRTCFDGTKCSNFNKRHPCPPNCGRDYGRSAGTICQNQFFNLPPSHFRSTRNNLRLFVRPEIGVGILTIKKIQPYTLIGEYMGLICSGEPAKEDMYILSLAKLKQGWYISSQLCGNFTRYINCCKVRPTCIAFGYIVDGLPRVLLLTRGFIPAGYELTFDYGSTYDVPDPCGCFNCSRDSRV